MDEDKISEDMNDDEINKKFYNTLLFTRPASDAIKYAGLLVGVYGVVQDRIDPGLILFGGFMYISGSLLKNLCDYIVTDGLIKDNKDKKDSKEESSDKKINLESKL